MNKEIPYEEFMEYLAWLNSKHYRHECVLIRKEMLEKTNELTQVRTMDKIINRKRRQPKIIRVSEIIM